jgi:hypothetical protein
VIRDRADSAVWVGFQVVVMVKASEDDRKSNQQRRAEQKRERPSPMWGPGLRVDVKRRK